jgi:hypothetical protein
MARRRPGQSRGPARRGRRRLRAKPASWLADLVEARLAGLCRTVKAARQCEAEMRWILSRGVLCSEKTFREPKLNHTRAFKTYKRDIQVVVQMTRWFKDQWLLSSRATFCVLWVSMDGCEPFAFTYQFLEVPGKQKSSLFFWSYRPDNLVRRHPNEQRQPSLPARE